MKGFISPRQAAARLGVRLNTLYAALWAGRLKANKVNGCWLIPVGEIEARLAKKTNSKK